MSGAALCAVCLNYCPLDADSFLIFPCGHGFCTGCISGLCSNPRPKCPNCRRILRKKDAHPVYIEFIDSQTYQETTLVEGLNKIEGDTSQNDVKKPATRPTLPNTKSEGSSITTTISGGDNLPSTSTRPDNPRPVPQQVCIGMPSRTSAIPGTSAINPRATVAVQNDGAIDVELLQLPPSTLIALKDLLGLGHKRVTDLSLSEKTQILTVCRARNMGLAQPVRMLPPQIHANSQTNRMKRNSISLGEESAAQPESSPPERKRVRRLSAEQSGGILLGTRPHHPPSQQLPPGVLVSLPPRPPHFIPQQATMQTPCPNLHGSATIRPPFPTPAQQYLMMRSAMLVPSSNQSVQGVMRTTQPHPGPMPGPQQPALSHPTASPESSSSSRPVPLCQYPISYLPPPPMRLVLPKEPNPVGMTATPLPGTNGLPLMRGQPPQPNGQPSQAPFQMASGSSSQSSPRSLAHLSNSSPHGCATQTPASSSQPLPGMNSMSIGIPRMNDSGDLARIWQPVDPRFKSLANEAANLDFERDFGQWFNNLEDELGSNV